MVPRLLLAFLQETAHCGDNPLAILLVFVHPPGADGGAPKLSSVAPAVSNEAALSHTQIAFCAQLSPEIAHMLSSPVTI